MISNFITSLLKKSNVYNNNNIKFINASYIIIIIMCIKINYKYNHGLIIIIINNDNEFLDCVCKIICQILTYNNCIHEHEKNVYI